MSPCRRCALTAPFHPYPHHATRGAARKRAIQGGVVSVPLSVGLPLLGVTQRRCPVEFGLSSGGRKRPHAAARPTLRGSHYISYPPALARACRQPRVSHVAGGAALRAARASRHARHAGKRVAPQIPSIFRCCRRSEPVTAQGSSSLRLHRSPDGVASQRPLCGASDTMAVEW